MLRTVLLATLTGIGITAAAVLALRYVNPPVTSVMLLQPGPVGAIEQTWIPRTAISTHLARAVIASEDQRFLDHHGIDFRSLGQAIEEYRDGEGLRGASTITQQVAKNVFLWQGRSLLRKGLEAYFAVLIELSWPKERILEVYLNIAELGPGIFGVEAAAQRYFGVNAASVSQSQAALLAAVLPNPKTLSVTAPGEYVRGRQSSITTQMNLLESRGHYRGLNWTVR